MTVDEFVASERVLPEYRPLIEKFRDLVKRDFPELIEEMRGGTEKYYGVPVYRRERILVTLSPTKQGMTYAFSDGASFDDKYTLLEGEGSKTKNIRWHTPEEFDEAAIKYYIEQAIEWDKKKDKS